MSLTLPPIPRLLLPFKAQASRRFVLQSKRDKEYARICSLHCSQYSTVYLPLHHAPESTLAILWKITGITDRLTWIFADEITIWEHAEARNLSNLNTFRPLIFGLITQKRVHKCVLVWMWRPEHCNSLRATRCNGSNPSPTKKLSIDEQCCLTTQIRLHLSNHATISGITVSMHKRTEVNKWSEIEKDWGIWVGYFASHSSCLFRQDCSHHSSGIAVVRGRKFQSTRALYYKHSTVSALYVDFTILRTTASRLEFDNKDRANCCFRQFHLFSPHRL